MKERAINGQSIFDLANQLLGTVDAAFELAMANNLSVTDAIPVGHEIELGDTTLKKLDVAAYFDGKKLATYTEITNGLMPVPQGIGFMAIEVDFIVS